MELNEVLGTIYKYEYAARLEGIAEGREEGKIEGQEIQLQKSLRSMLQLLRDLGKSKDEACKLVKDKIELPLDDINKAIEEIYI